MLLSFVTALGKFARLLLIEKSSLTYCPLFDRLHLTASDSFSIGTDRTVACPEILGATAMTVTTIP